MVNTHWATATVGKKGEVVLENLPFPPGQSVEVLVRVKRSSTAEPTHNLLGSVLKYEDPCEPVASEDWDAPTLILQLLT